MREINHAIEEVSEFNGFVRKLVEPLEPRMDGRVGDYRPGENRAERRARQRAEKRNAKRKVMA